MRGPTSGHETPTSCPNSTHDFSAAYARAHTQIQTSTKHPRICFGVSSMAGDVAVKTLKAVNPCSLQKAVNPCGGLGSQSSTQEVTPVVISMRRLATPVGIICTKKSLRARGSQGDTVCGGWGCSTPWMAPAGRLSH